jgi:ribose transport system ATP-binding protein
MTAVLRVEGMAKRYGATIALDGVDLEVRAGEVHALIGENGAGKSTLMAVLAGAVRADSGEMQLQGVRFAPATTHDARRNGVALIHQELSLCPHLTVEENVLLGGELSRRGVIDRRRTRARALALLDELPHPEIRPGRRVAELSLPARQIVAHSRPTPASSSWTSPRAHCKVLMWSGCSRLSGASHRVASR